MAKIRLLNGPDARWGIPMKIFGEVGACDWFADGNAMKIGLMFCYSIQNLVLFLNFLYIL